MVRPSHASSANMPLRVGRYELLIPIASGGMATVYLALSSGFGGFEREVALKLTHVHLREQADFALDLLEEAKLAVRIKHPHVVPVLDVGDDPNGVFLVMDYIEGDSLSGLLRAAKHAKTEIPPRVLLRILLDAVAGLHAAHELTDAKGLALGVVHRDFSPQNILVGTDGLAKLADFGVAKAASRLSHTVSGLIKGKLGYLSPEQASNQALDRRSDVWAAGVIAWELFAGRRLFQCETEIATVLAVVNDTPPRLSRVVSHVSPALDAAIASALERDRSHRCATAAEFAQRVKEGFGQPLAETSEVAELVRQLTAEKLSARRARVEEARELRARMGKLVESAAHISPDSVSPERSGAEETQLLSGSDLVSVTRAAPEQVQTDTTSSVPTRDKAPVSRIRWLALAVVASVIVVVVVFSLRRSASNAANPEAVRVASAPIPSPSPPTSAPADPRERAPAPVVTPSADKRKSKPPTHVRKPSATPSLPDNPYEN